MIKPRIHKIVPVLGIASHQDAIDHYINWLGFDLDWEWREAAGQPTIISISRDDISIMLNEFGVVAAGAHITLHVLNLDALAEEWNTRRPGSAVVELEMPYEIPTVSVTDTFGNCLRFQGENPIEWCREENEPEMRAFIQAKLDAGDPFPTPQEVRDAVGPVLGLAIEVLNSFPGYAEAYKARGADSSE